MIESIQSSGYGAAWVVAGGGTGALHALLSHPGASRFVLDAQIPYSPQALEAYLGARPEHCCSEDTALCLAYAAFSRAQQLGAEKPLGVACTAALQTSRERKGKDRAYISLRTTEHDWLFKICFLEQDRVMQEIVLSEAMLELIAASICRERSLIPLKGVQCQLISTHS